MGKPYITPEGYEMLHRELDYLWKEKRPDVTAKVAWAASLGDRSENADYHYNKRLLAQIDRRVRYLRRRLNELQVVRHEPRQEGRVFFGAYVEIQADDDDSIRKLRIAGGDEIFGRSNYISIDSPMARALLGKAEGDEAAVAAPRGRRIWFVNKIAYETPDWFVEEKAVDPRLDEGGDDEAAAAGEISEEEQKKIQEEYLEALARSGG